MATLAADLQEKKTAWLIFSMTEASLCQDLPWSSGPEPSGPRAAYEFADRAVVIVQFRRIVPKNLSPSSSFRRSLCPEQSGLSLGLDVEHQRKPKVHSQFSTHVDTKLVWHIVRNTVRKAAVKRDIS